MKPIYLLAVGDVERRLMDAVRDSLAREYATRCLVDARIVDPAFAYHPERNQYHSTHLVEKLMQFDGAGRQLLGITAVDLFIPILTFVFGEAQLSGSCAVVSYHRLHQSFYGLPPDDDLLVERLIKEAVHEIGHTFGLTHCDDYECVMAASHSVEWLDVKGPALCPDCRDRAAV
jgi:archaemetzincin